MFAQMFMINKSTEYGWVRCCTVNHTCTLTKRAIHVLINPLFAYVWHAEENELNFTNMRGHLQTGDNPQ